MENNRNKIKRERETTGEDALLIQIDAFRDKAKQLQGLINGRENRVRELEAMVREKEAQNAQLEKELLYRQRQADGLVTDVEDRVDAAMDQFQENVGSLEKHLDDSLQGMEQRIGDNVDGIKGSLSEKVHTENVMQYRNIQDLLKEYDSREDQEKIAMSNYKSLKKKMTGITVLVVFNLLFSIATLIFFIWMCAL